MHDSRLQDLMRIVTFETGAPAERKIDDIRLSKATLFCYFVILLFYFGPFLTPFSATCRPTRAVGYTSTYCPC